MPENIASQESVFLSFEEKQAVEQGLIGLYCEGATNTKDRRERGKEWANQFGGNFEQLSKEVIEQYRDSKTKEEKRLALKAIQKALDKLAEESRSKKE